jgi:uncharacterized protein (TIGR02594 family)
MIPSKYSFLENIGTLPKLISAAIQYLGIKEMPGIKSNPAIINMATTIGLKGVYNDDDIAWCAVFINFLCSITGKPTVKIKGDLYNLMRASEFMNWGNEVKIEQAQLGDIVVFKRPGGYHVAIIIAESKTTLHVIGGNQGNSVSIAEFSKDNVAAIRRFYATQAPSSAIRYLIDSSGHVLNQAA